MGSTSYLFRSRITEATDENGEPIGDKVVEIKLNNADEMTYTALCEEFKNFLISSGFTYLRGPLEFPEMEAEKTLQRLKAPDDPIRN